MDADFWTAVAAISQAATVAVAGWALIYARGQVKEARETRERVAQPEVVVFIDHHQVRGYVDLVVKNFGQTTAYNVKISLPPLEVAPYNNLHDGNRVTHAYMPDRIAVLAPGQEWRSLWDSMVRREKYNGTLRDQYGGIVEFDDKVDGPDKRSFSNPIALDIRMFWNTMWIERSSSKSVEKALYQIADTLSGFGSEHDGLWVYTESGQDERDYQQQLAAHRREVHEHFVNELTGGNRQTTAEDAD